MNRRHFFLFLPALALSTIELPTSSLATPLAIHSKTQLLPRNGKKGPRIVICGGG